MILFRHHKSFSLNFACKNPYSKLFHKCKYYSTAKQETGEFCVQLVSFALLALLSE